MIDKAEIAERYEDVKSRIADARKRGESYHRRLMPDVCLIAVGKKQPVEKIEVLLELGHRHFGENRIQEAAAKWPQLKKEHPDVVLHFIGPLQTNKVSEALTLFDAIHSVDRPKLAHRLSAEMQRSGKRPLCFVQVNTGEEPQKSGVSPSETDAFVRDCVERHGLNVGGLMCIPPKDDEPSLHFALLKKMAERNGLDLVSMGMSADFELAIELGATHVRVGTSLFGPRGTNV